ncbi:MAG: hypothetical protein WCU88_00060 [Elusimicrobiota bacterium]|jgi:hypothetical protein
MPPPEKAALAPNSPEALQIAEAERITRFRRAGEEYLREAHARISEAQTCLMRGLGHLPLGRLREEIRRIVQEMSSAKAEFDKKAALFREQYLAVASDDGDFRAHLALLEVQYEARVRAAETGLRLLLDSFEAHLRGPSEGIEGLCDQAHEALGARLYPVHAELLGALQQETRRHDELQKRMEDLRVERDSALEQTRRETAQIHELAQEISRLLAKERQSAAQARSENERSEQILRSRLEKVESWLKTAEAERDKSWKELDRAQKEADQLRAEALTFEGKLREAQSAAQDAGRRAAEAARQALAPKEKAELEKLRAALKAAEEEALAVRAALEQSEADRRAAQAQAISKGESAQAKEEVARMQALLHGVEAERAAMRESFARKEAEFKVALESAAASATVAAAAAAAQIGPGAVVGAGELQELTRLRALQESSEREKDILRARTETLEKRLREAESGRDKAWESAEWARKESDSLREKVQEMLKRNFVSDARRDKDLLENAANWSSEKADLMEKMEITEGQLATLRTAYDQSNRDWEQALAAQDAKRLEEIFQLRTELKRLQDAGSSWNKDFRAQPPREDA